LRGRPDERVYSIYLDDDHNAAQLVERLGWAITTPRICNGPSRSC